MRLLLALVLAASPALAEEAAVIDTSVPPVAGSVALYLQAHGLYDLGQAQKDPLLVLTAARILHGLTLTETKRLPDPPHETPTTVTTRDAAAALDTARSLDAGQNYADLIDMLAREVPPAPRALRVTASTLSPGESEVWTLTFFGGSYSELAILGTGKSNLDMVVTAAGDTQICLDRGSRDVALCGFVLMDNGDVRVNISNVGRMPDSYLLLTE